MITDEESDSEEFARSLAVDTVGANARRIGVFESLKELLGVAFGTDTEQCVQHVLRKGHNGRVIVAGPLSEEITGRCEVLDEVLPCQLFEVVTLGTAFGITDFEAPRELILPEEE